FGRSSGRQDFLYGIKDARRPEVPREARPRRKPLFDPTIPVRMPDLRPLLSPDSVAIVGAAANDSLRGRLTRFLIEHEFPGRIYPVTRSQNEVLGYKAYAAIGDLPEAPELAVILVPAAHVVGAIEQCAARGIPAAVVISSGFAEERGEEAAARDAALRAIA